MHATERVETAGLVQDHSLHNRIRGEFMEMPGMKLTIRQAARLFDVDAGRCQQVLDLLVTHGVLAAAGGMFMSANAGRRQA